MISEHFSVHRGQFLSDSDVRGLVFRLRHRIRAFARVFWVIRCQKTVSTKCVVTKDRARTLTSELSQGTLGTEITLKKVLEGPISLSYVRVGRGVSRRCSQSLQATPDDKYWPRNHQISDSESFSEIQDFGRFLQCRQPYVPSTVVFQQWRRFSPYNYPEMFRKRLLTWSRPFREQIDGYWWGVYLRM